MAEEAKVAVEKRMDFVGMDQVPAIYADSFLVAHTGDVDSLYFFQTQIPAIKSGVLGSTGALESKEAKCVVRIILSERGFEKLFDAMATNIKAQEKK